jgi:DNA polymerase-3 subunit alpha
MNKLQLEGLVKAGAFDSLNKNRQSLFDSIPNFILKTKNLFDNRSANQIDLFSDDETAQNDIINDIQDWKFEDRLSKEFEAVGFFISDHPLNQFTEIFDDYKIIDYSNFNSNDDVKDANIAATLLKIQERKTAKGNTYAVLKLTDLYSVFELFIFSDILELNREILKEGNSLILTLVKNNSNDDNRFKRINVQKIASLKDLFNSPINEVSFNIKSNDQVNEILKIINNQENGKTTVKINMAVEEKTLIFRLKNMRKLDRKSLNLLRKQEISSTIN